MKTTATLFISLFLIGFLQAGNSTGDNAKIIRASLTMPEALKQQASKHRDGQKVLISFMVNEEGKVTEANAKISNSEAKKDLESQFIKLSFKDLKACVQHQIEIKFLLY